MNYYDELGVGRDAPATEIRQAYRVLVRLLHPDAQTDDELRGAAERQLNRLNAIAEVLTTPELRRAYDLQLDLDSCHKPVPAATAPRPEPGPQFDQWQRNAAGLPPSRKPLIQLVVRHWSFVLIAAVACVAALLSVLLQGQNEPLAQSREAEEAGSVSSAMPAVSPARRPLPRRVPETATEPQAVPDKVAPANVKTAQAASPKPLIRTADTARATAESPLPPQSGLLLARPAATVNAPQERPLRAELPVVAAAASSSTSFAGNWFYSADLDSSKEAYGYRAVYVELLLSQSGETLSGNYRAQYVIPDKAISPQVAFHLEGKVGTGEKARVGWTATNGAKGEAELTLSTRGIMDFHWWSTDLPQSASLSSGTARLIRQRVP